MPKNVSKVTLTAEDKTKIAFNSMQSNISGATNKVAMLAGGVATLAGDGGLGYLVQQQFEAIDSLAKWSDKLGTSTEALAKLQFAVGQTSDVTDKQFNTALQRMTRRVAEAANGTGEARKAIQELGLDAQKLKDMGPDEAFLQISDAMKEVEGQGDRVRLAFKLFDSEGVSLVNTLDEGSEKLRELGREAELAGLAVNRMDAAKIEAANDAFDKAQKLSVGFGRAIAVQVAPVVSDLASRFFNAAVEAGGMGEIVNSGMVAGLKVIGLFGDGLRGIQIIYQTLKALSMEWVTKQIEALAYADEALTGFLNKIPGVTAEVSQGLKYVANSLREETDAAWDGLHEKMMAPLPSDAIEEWYANVQRKSEEAALILAKDKENSLGAGGGGDGKEEVDALKLKLGELKLLTDTHQATTAESEQLAYLKRLEMLRENYESGVIPSLEAYHAHIANVAQKHQNKLTDMTKKAADKRLKYNGKSYKNETEAVLGFMSQQTSGIASESKEAFQLNKQLATANAMLKMGEAVQGAYAFGNNVGGPYVGAAFAAVAAVVSFKNIQQIQSQQFSGGGSTASYNSSSGVISSPAAPTDIESGSSVGFGEESEPSGGLTIIFQGDVTGLNESDLADSLIETIQDRVNNQDLLLIEGSSANGRALGTAA